MKFIINRSTWLRGEGTYNSYLLRKTDGKMCCLGQIALQCGADRNKILQYTAPYQGISKLFDNLSLVVRNVGTDEENWNIKSWIGDAMGINDNDDIEDSVREYDLVDLFGKHGYKLEFVDEIN